MDINAKIKANESQIFKLKCELKKVNKELTEIIDYAKFYICPTCTNTCINCPVWDFERVECIACGEMLYRKDAAENKFDHDYICKKCERESRE